MTMHRQEVRFTGCLAILIALAGAMLMTATPVRAGSSVAGAGDLNFHPHFAMHPRVAVHPGFGMASSRSIVMLPPLGPGIVPPLGPGIVPPLVSGQSRFDRRRFRSFFFSPFGFGFGDGIFIDAMPGSVALSAQRAAAPRLPPPQPDFQPHIITLQPDAAVAGDSRSVVILRPGQPDEVKRFGDGAH